MATYKWVPRNTPKFILHLAMLHRSTRWLSTWLVWCQWKGTNWWFCMPFSNAWELLEHLSVAYLSPITLLASLMSSPNLMKNIFWEISSHPLLLTLAPSQFSTLDWRGDHDAMVYTRSCWDGKGCGNVQMNCALVVPWENLWHGGGWGIRSLVNRTSPNLPEYAKWLSCRCLQ